MHMISGLKFKFETYRLRRRWRKLRARGMKIGKGVNLPMSTWIDTDHCFLISIGDNCGFGDSCAILAHDAMPNEYLDATKIGRVTIGESCHFGMRTIILPGVEIGARCVIGSGSVVIKDIPAGSVAAGNPAKVICTLDEYLDRHREWLKTMPKFPYKEYSIEYLSPEKKREMMEKLAATAGYITGGYTAMVNDKECLVRT
jgi:maltose O-acetyltransferase